jgi:glycosyltransferase involved in cell wall biosynthesis
LISVVIPTYNRALDLKRALVSLTNQNYKKFEVLICDDGSTDNTFEIANEFKSKLNINYKKIQNSGKPAIPRNLGIANAKGKYIAFLDSDDWWHENKLQLAFEYLENGADLVYSDFFSVKSLKKFDCIKVRRLSDNVTKDLLMNGNPICTSSVIVRKSILDVVGLFNEDTDFIAWEDFDLWLRISKHTNKLIHIPETLIYYWEGGGNISTNIRKIFTWQAIRRYYIKNAEYSCPWIYKSLGNSLFKLKKYYYSLPYLVIANKNSVGFEKFKVTVKIFLAKWFFPYLIKFSKFINFSK